MSKNNHLAAFFSFSILSAVIVIFLTAGTLYARPHNGDIFKLRQPDGTLVPVKVWGDEFYQRVESMDGYTLVRDAQGWICYAQLQGDSVLIPTTARYSGENFSSLRTPLAITKGLEIKPVLRSLKRRTVLQQWSRKSGFKGYGTPERKPYRGNKVYALTVLIDFSDQPSTISNTAFNDYLNKPGYTGYNNNGSIRDYFMDVSGGKLDYENQCYGYYRAKKPKMYYDDINDSMCVKAQELIKEALLYMRDTAHFDFSKLTTDSIPGFFRYALATNFFYAGFPEAGWARGLWPHSWVVQDTILVGNNVRIYPYQMTDVGDDLNLGTFCHENGHMVMNFPDLYDYTYQSSGVGRYCLMCLSPDKNPVPPCAPLRHYAGWETLIDISKIKPGTKCPIVSNAAQSYVLCNPKDSLEFFYIESRVNKNRSMSLPDFGLLIWHADWNLVASGFFSNDFNQMTADSHYIVSLEQADNRFDMERYVNYGNTGDLFYKKGSNRFDDNTGPNAHWWKNTASTLKITNISTPGDTMFFFNGDIPLVVTYPESGDTLVPGDTVLIQWTYDQNATPKSISTVRLEHSYKRADGTQGQTVIDSAAPNINVYRWVVPNMPPVSGADQHYITICNKDSAEQRYTTERFVVKNPALLSVSVNGTVQLNVKKGQTATTNMAIANKGKEKLEYVTASCNNGHVVVNEVYPCSPSKYFDGFELWNQGQDVNMKGWKIIWIDNGATSNTYTFSKDFIFKSGKTLVFKDFEDRDNDSMFYIGHNLYWNYTDNSQGGFKLSIAVINNLGICVDFFRSLRSGDAPPFGGVWNGYGVPLDKDFIYRCKNQNTTGAADWKSDTVGTIGKLNPGENNNNTFTLWTDIKNGTGTVDSGANKSIDISFLTGALDIGSYTEYIGIVHNDRTVPSPYMVKYVINIQQTGIQNLTDSPYKGSIKVSPNPAHRKGTGIRFSSDKRAVSLTAVTIYDCTGNVVRSLEYPSVGSWDLRDRNGALVAGGAYVAVMKITSGNGKIDLVKAMIGISE